MAWTDQDEAVFQKRRAEHFAQVQQEDRQKAEMVRMGLREKCPNCGSHRFSQGVYHEACDDCGLSNGY